MLLVITNSADATADYLCKRLGEKSIAFARINTEEAPRTVKVKYRNLGASLMLDGEELEPEDIKDIWLRRPHMPVAKTGADPSEQEHTAAEWAEALDGFLAHVPIACWINHPAHNAMASHKLEQLSRAANFGLKVPSTLVTQDTAELREFWASTKGNVIVKPLASGFIERDGKGDSIIYTSPVELHHLDNPDILCRCPTLFQERINKTTDVRVCAVDGRLAAVQMVGLDKQGNQLLDIRRNNMLGISYKEIVMPKLVEQRIASLLQSYKLRFSAVDLAIDHNGDWIFFEINPNGQWAWLDLCGAADIGGLFLKAFSRP